jgi:hypothetical protein
MKQTTGVNAYMTEVNPLPFGTPDLDPQQHVIDGPPRRIRCYVRGCKELLRPPAEGYDGEVCPAHGIRCHTSGTYSYADVRRNIIIAPDKFVVGIVRNPFKYETKRLGNENSEDALTWNLFRTLQECGLLHVVAQWITGLDIDAEPHLYLWGICLTGDTFEPWDLLIAARQRFENNLPVDRPQTEPDIALYLPGYYLILIEAKFTSPNPFYVDGPRRDERSLTKNELLDIYQDADLQMLDVENARRAERVHYQLWRNVVFAEWMARVVEPDTSAYVANLTRADQEHESCAQFQGMMDAKNDRGFVHLSWENIYTVTAQGPELWQLCQYLETKTSGLVRALKCKHEAAHHS